MHKKYFKSDGIEKYIFDPVDSR